VHGRIVAVHSPVREPRNSVAGALRRSRACDRTRVAGVVCYPESKSKLGQDEPVQ
jgi:hypothetical protein